MKMARPDTIGTGHPRGLEGWYWDLRASHISGKAKVEEAYADLVPVSDFRTNNHPLSRSYFLLPALQLSKLPPLLSLPSW